MGAEKSKKGSHLTKEERRIIAVLHEEGRSPYEIGKLTGRASNTIRNELKRGTSWRRTRDSLPVCKECLCKYLCPSPSNYELAIGKSNLCHVKS